MSDITNKLWFKRRRYGWGWTPVTWQGWLVIILCLAIVFASAVKFLPANPLQPTSGQLTAFLMISGGAIFTLFGVAFLKGPVPRFRWGKKPTDNPDEDY